MSNIRIKRIKSGKKVLEDINENKMRYLIIHYSCESFYNINDGRTPRITSIAIRYLATAQTVSFSIHKIAERKHMLDNIEGNYDILEKEMLKEYFKFINEHKDYLWIHWNMRDGNYGFNAIENRYQVLSGRVNEIEDSKKVDLARLMVDLYGLNYMGHPRLENLIDINSIGKKDFLKGAEEAMAFQNKEFIKLHQSTLRKVDIFNTIIEKLIDGTLKTNSTLKDRYGITPEGIHSMISDNWFISLACWSMTMIVSGVVGFYISKLLE